MSEISFDGRRLAIERDETVLDALLRNGVEVDHSCRSGICQSCLLRVRSGRVPDAALDGLSQDLRARGGFLACQARGVDALDVTRLGDDELASDSIRVEVIGKRWLAPDVVELRLEPEVPIEARAGQHVSLVRPDGLSRRYSIASLPDRDRYLELHVRVVRNGQMSGFVARDLVVGDEIAVRGTAGACCYCPGDPDQPLLLVGTSTGLAPLLGVARDAIRHAHRGPITLLHGAVDAVGLYYRSELDRIAAEFGGLTVEYSALHGDSGDPRILRESLPELVATRFRDLTKHRVYLCGAPDFVAAMRRDVFLSGANFHSIHADAFLSRVPAAAHEGAK